MDSIHNFFTPVIRSCGERTTSVCKSLLAEVFPENDISIINEKPFERALKKGYEIGINTNRKWTFFLDADVLINKDRLHKVMEFCLKADDNTLTVQPIIHDKLWNIPRQGTYFYNTKYLPEAIQAIPQAGSCDRPESTGVLVALENLKGLKRVTCDVVYALHDYEQWYADIYRKSYVFANKFSDYFFLLTPLWKKLAVNDDDFKIALAGAYHAKSNLNFRGIDKDTIPAETEGLLGKICDAKPKLEDICLATVKTQVNDILSNWKPDYLYRCIEFYMQRRRTPVAKHIFNSLKSALMAGTLTKELKAHFYARALSYLTKKV